jgi:hypothetical protein
MDAPALRLWHFGERRMTYFSKHVVTLMRLAHEYGFDDIPVEFQGKTHDLKTYSIPSIIFSACGTALFIRYANQHGSGPKEYVFESMAHETAKIIKLAVDRRDLDFRELWVLRINGQPRDLLAKVEAYKESQHARNQNLPQE